MAPVWLGRGPSWICEGPWSSLLLSAAIRGTGSQAQGHGGENESQHRTALQIQCRKWKNRSPSECAGSRQPDFETKTISLAFACGSRVGAARLTAGLDCGRYGLLIPIAREHRVHGVHGTREATGRWVFNECVEFRCATADLLIRTTPRTV